MTTTATPPATETNTAADPRVVATGQLFTALAADPKYRKEVLALIKKAAPDTPIPELDLESNIVKTIQDSLKPNSEEVKELREGLAALQRERQRDQWKAQHGLSEEECVEIENLAKTEQIGKGDTAVEIWRHRQSLGTPRGTRRTPPGAEEYLKKLSGVSPRDTKRLKAIATEESVKIFQTQRKAS